MTRTPLRHLRLLLREADPRPAMILAAADALAQGVSVGMRGVGAVVGRVPSVLEKATLGAFDAVPGVILGALFVAAGGAVLVGIARGREYAVRFGALALFALWAYAWVTLPLALALQGTWSPTGWSRYTTCLVVAWWIYARSPSSVRLSFGALFASRRPALPLMLVVSPVIAIELSMPSDVTGTVLIGAAVSALTLAGKALADRWTTKADFSKAMTASAAEKDTLLWGIARDEIKQYREELAHLRGQFSAFLQVRDTQDKFCRNHCPTYTDRPPG